MIKPSDHGIVVDHLPTGNRYAISDRHYDQRVHRKVRDLEPGETVIGYVHKPRQDRELREDSSSSPEDLATQAEGSSSEDAEGNE